MEPINANPEAAKPKRPMNLMDCLMLANRLDELLRHMTSAREEAKLVRAVVRRLRDGQPYEALATARTYWGVLGSYLDIATALSAQWPELISAVAPPRS